MSDTPNPAVLASAAEFDEKLKRTDEDRWLASRYAPREGRERLVAVYLLNQELQRALQAREAMLAKIRIQWWRETLEALPAKVRRHDLTKELARVMAGRDDIRLALLELVDRYDDIADDHIASGHQASAEHEARHYAAEAQLARAAGRALRAGLTTDEGDALARCAEAHLARVAGMSDAEVRWAAAKAAARSLGADLWPAIVHLAARPDHKPLARRFRMFRAMFGRRLG